MLNSLRSRLRFLLFLIAMPGIVFVIVQAFIDRHTTIDSYRQQTMGVAEDLVAQQGRIIEETRVFLKHLAGAAPVQTPDDPACGQFLQMILGMVPQYSNLGVPGPDGNLTCNALPLPGPVNVSDRSYFRHSLTTLEFAMSDFQHDRAARLPSVNFSYPVMSDTADGEVAGVAVAVVSLAWWSRLLVDQHMPDGAVAFISDRNGTIAASHPLSQDLIGASLSDFGLTGLPSKGGGDSSVVTGKDGIARLFTHGIILEHDGQADALVSVGVPVGPGLRAANVQTLQRLLALALATLVALFLVRALLYRDVLRPLSALTSTVHRLERSPGTGTMNGLEDTQKVREFSSLNRRFLSMAGARRAAEQAEQRHREELLAVLDALPDLYFRIDRQGTILDYRAGSANDLFVTPDEFLGRRLADLLPPSVLSEFDANLKQRLETNRMTGWEYTLEIGGMRQEFEARACPIQNSEETVLVIRNITARKQDEVALRRAATVYQASSEGMAITSGNGTIVTTNPALAQLTGWSINEMVGQGFDQLISRRDRKMARDGFKAALAPGRGWSQEILLRRKDGSSVPGWISANAILGDNRDTQTQGLVILVRDMTALKEANETIWRQAHFDTLTQLPNRTSLTETLPKVLDDAADADQQVALLFLDLDGLKQVNDRLGHDAGDMLLKKTAKRLLAGVGNGDFVARQGGDEFTVVLPANPDADHAREVAKSLLRDLAKPFRIGRETVYLTASLGIASFPSDAETPEELLKAADQAMYAAKSSGRNRYTLFSPDIRQAASDKAQLISDIQPALDKGQFELFFQPIIDLQSGLVAKAEALIRWHHPKQGQIQPARFIPLAEEAGLINLVGDWVLDQSCASLNHLKGRFGKGFQVCLNLSPLQLDAMGTGTGGWPDRLARCGQSGEALIAEITEGALLDHDGHVSEQLNTLRKAGINLALDDFGTGYSSLFYFLQHKFDYLKIDRGFVHHLNDTPDAEALCETMIGMAQRLKVRVIAEGIETQHQCTLLTGMGCHFGQGYLFGRAMPLEQFLKLPAQSELFRNQDG